VLLLRHDRRVGDELHRSACRGDLDDLPCGELLARRGRDDRLTSERRGDVSVFLLVPIRATIVDEDSVGQPCADCLPQLLLAAAIADDETEGAHAGDQLTRRHPDFLKRTIAPVNL